MCSFMALYKSVFNFNLMLVKKYVSVCVDSFFSSLGKEYDVGLRFVFCFFCFVSYQRRVYFVYILPENF